MKAALFLAATGAALAAAGPIAGNHAALHKRAMETDWVVEVKTVTVTEGNIPSEPTKAAQPPAEKEDEPKVPPVVLNPEDSKPSGGKKVYPQPTQPAQEPKPTYEAPTQDPPKDNKPAPENPSSGAGDYGDMMLKQHNVHRANHSAPALTWDSELASYAQTLGNRCKFDHDTNIGGGGYGQNLASKGTSSDISGLKNQYAAEGVTEQWYNGEVEMFNQFYGNAMNDIPHEELMKWGHFTAMVWKSTKRVGCATVQCPAGTVLGTDSWYTVCNYGPPGNMGGAFAENVLRPNNADTVHV